VVGRTGGKRATIAAVARYSLMKFRRTMLAAFAAVFLGSPLLAAEDGRSAWLRRVEDGRRDYERFATRAFENFAAGNVAFRRNAAAPPANYAEDATLRAGDVVMTDRGMRVFVGAPGGAASFKTLEEWRGDGKWRTELLQMQKASLKEFVESAP